MARTELGKAVPEAYRTTIALSKQADAAALDAGLDPLTLELVRIRVSQINGCAYCLRLHTRDALAKGEAADRIAVLPAWRETGYFTAAECAALAIAEEITNIVDHGEPDTSALDDRQAAAVRWVAVVINSFNRIAISSRYAVEPGG